MTVPNWREQESIPESIKKTIYDKFAIFAKLLRQTKSKKWLYLSEICAERIFLCISPMAKHVKMDRKQPSLVMCLPQIKANLQCDLLLVTRKGNNNYSNDNNWKKNHMLITITIKVSWIKLMQALHCPNRVY